LFCDIFLSYLIYVFVRAAASTPPQISQNLFQVLPKFKLKFKFKFKFLQIYSKFKFRAGPPIFVLLDSFQILSEFELKLKFKFKFLRIYSKSCSNSNSYLSLNSNLPRGPDHPHRPPCGPTSPSRANNTLEKSVEPWVKVVASTLPQISPNLFQILPEFKLKFKFKFKFLRIYSKFKSRAGPTIFVLLVLFQILYEFELKLKFKFKFL
jgi:hypothetical protein